MKNKNVLNKRRFIAIALILLIFAALHISFSMIGGFAEIYNRTAGAFFRIVPEKLSAWIPFSIAEFLLIVSPLILSVVLFAIINSSRKAKQRITVILLALSVLICAIYGSFVLTFSAGYLSDTIEQKASLERRKVTKDKLIGAMEYLTKQLNELSDSLYFTQDSGTRIPYDWYFLTQKLNEAYNKSEIKELIPSSFNSSPKRIALSEPMTYTHISGVYTFFSGESNVNVNYPDFIIPFTAAHEMSHQRGVAKEDEANYVAFLVCETSSDPYVRYSGLLNMYEYISNDLYRTDRDEYRAVYSRLDDRVKKELSAYSKFFDRYRDSEISKVSNKVNDLYLSSQGTEGVISYDLVTELYIALLCQRGILRNS